MDKEEVMKYLIPIIFCLSSFSAIAQDKPWSDCIDTIKGYFIIKFKYPNRFVAEGIENGRCIGKPRKAKKRG